MNGTILLIDDCDEDNFIHTRAIRTTGMPFQVAVATSVDEGITHLRSHAAASRTLVLLDINMPAKDGWDFLREFAALPAECRQQTRIVMLTSSANPADRKRAAANNGVSGYLEKPLTRDSLLQLLGNPW